MKLSYKKILYFLLIIYPVINIIVYFIFHGNNMNIFSCVYCFALFILNMAATKGKVVKTDIPMIVWMLLTVILSFARESSYSFGSGSLLLVGTMIYLMLFSENARYNLIDGAIINRYEKLFLTAQIIYIGLLLIYVIQNGLTYGWGTRVLQGPYNYPHTLAYILLLFTMGDFFYFIKNRDKISLIFATVTIALILMTAVRTVILSLVVVLLYILKEFLDIKKIKNLISLIFFGLIGFYFINRYNLINALFQKTALAVQNNSITNGRWAILVASLNSIRTFQGDPIYAFLFGIGMSALTSNNYLTYGAAIHAHNDFVDIIVCYGVINLVIYIYLFLRFTKTGRLWFLLTIGLLAIGNGLYMYIEAVPMLYISRVLFESGKKSSYINFIKVRRMKQHEKNSVRL